MHWIRRHSRGRPPHPDILTPAEWRVLAEVREGRTNAEIAARTGLSFNTVKTHVASILAKTGLPDRYALAEWDGAPGTATGTAAGAGSATSTPARARGIALPLAGWLTGGAVKVVAGGLGAVVLVGAVVVVFSQLVVGGEDVPVVPGAVADGVPGLYLEADVTMVYPGSTRAEPVVLALRWWAAESGARRFEVDGFPGASVGAAEYSFPSLLDTRNQLIVHDGDQSAVYDEDHDAFVETSVTESASPYGLGHYPDLPESDSLDEFVEHLSSLLDRELRHTGTEELLDRDVEVFEDGDGSAGGQVHRLYIDPGELVVLRADIGEVSAQVTRLEIDALIDPALLEFASPPESDLARCPRTEGAGVSPFVTLNPSGWIEEVTGRGGCVPDGGSATQMTIFQPSGGGEGYVLFEQTRRLGARVPESLRGTSIEVGGQPGWRSTAGNGIERVAWESDGVVAMLESDVLDVDELIEVAGSARGGPVADLVSEQTGIEAVDAVLPLIVRGDYESVMEMRVLDMVECSVPPPGEAMTVPCLDGEPPGTEVEAFHSGSQCQSELVRNDEPGREQMLAGLSTIGAGTPVVLGMLSPEVAEAKGIEGPAYVVIFKTEEPRVRGYYVLISEDGVEGWDGGCGPVQFYVGTLAAEILLQ